MQMLCTQEEKPSKTFPSVQRKISDCVRILMPPYCFLHPVCLLTFDDKYENAKLAYTEDLASTAEK